MINAITVLPSAHCTRAGANYFNCISSSGRLIPISTNANGRSEAFKPCLDEGIESGKHYFQFAIRKADSPRVEIGRRIGVQPALFPPTRLD